MSFQTAFARLSRQAFLVLGLLLAFPYQVLSQSSGQPAAPPLAPDMHKKQALQGGVAAADALAGSNQFRINVANIANFVELPAVTGKSQSARVEPQVFRAWLSKAHPDFTLNGQVQNEADVVEIGGQWDKADKTLTKFQIPFRHIKAREISPEILAQCKVLVVNCAGEIKRDKLQYIRDFVSRGGYLLTTDWALDNMLVQTFPGYLSWNKAVNHKDIYDAEYIAPDAVLAVNCVRNAFWKLDQASHLVKVLKPEAVKVLVHSRQLAGEDPDHAGIMAAIFPFGRGYVLHMVGHFDNNAKIAVGNFLPDPAPGIGISLRQAIACNFIVAAIEGKKMP
jgi:hypothetical protein